MCIRDSATEERQKDMKAIEKEYKGLHIAGGVIDGIGMANRITQGMNLAQQLIKEIE